MAKPRRAPDHPQSSARRAARLAAVQALYQLDMNDVAPAVVIAEFVGHRLEEHADRQLFSDLVGSVAARVVEIDGKIGAALVEGWTVERLETVLRAILRAGTYELMARPDIPPKVAISEYVEIAHAFFGGREPGLVNGVLHRLAGELRGADLESG
ncbi:MAG: transcription antitermination factor NusB [Proteobacteria bacterium]|nr:transcription antitermination factor NusB [Pseudomonadota bacterium]